MKIKDKIIVIHTILAIVGYIIFIWFGYKYLSTIDIDLTRSILGLLLFITSMFWILQNEKNEK